MTAPLIFCWALAAIARPAQFRPGKHSKVARHPLHGHHGGLGLSAYEIPCRGMVFGIGAAFIEEYAARLFYNHGSNHLDPPGIAIATLIMNLLFKPEYLNFSQYF